MSLTRWARPCLRTSWIDSWSKRRGQERDRGRRGRAAPASAADPAPGPQAPPAARRGSLAPPPCCTGRGRIDRRRGGHGRHRDQAPAMRAVNLVLLAAGLDLKRGGAVRAAARDLWHICSQIETGFLGRSTRSSRPRLRPGRTGRTFQSTNAARLGASGRQTLTERPGELPAKA